MSRVAERPAAAGKAVADEPELEAKVLGESKYDQITSMLMAILAGAILVVAWLGLVYVSTHAFAARVTAPLQIIEVFGGGGGSPDGTPGSTEKIDIAGADASAMASNNEEAAGDFEEPSVQQTPGAMLDVAVEAGQSLAEVDLGAVMPSGGQVASGKRASKLGTGGPGLGFGPGDGGVPAEQRWSIVYKPGQPETEYARQLDALGVEMAVVVPPDQLTYVSNFSSATPTRRTGSSRGDHRLYFLWQGRGRKENDIAPDSGKPESRSGRTRSFSFIPKRRNDAWPSWKFGSREGSRPKSGSLDSQLFPAAAAMTSRSPPRNHYARRSRPSHPENESSLHGHSRSTRQPGPRSIR